MSTPLIEAIADGQDATDDHVEKAQAYFRARQEQLLNTPKERDLQLWKSWGVDNQVIEKSLSEIESLAKGQHDEYWKYAVGGLMAACFKQTFFEFSVRRVLSMSSENRNRIRKISTKMPRKDVKEQALIGVSKDDVAAARGRRNGTASKQ